MITSPKKRRLPSFGGGNSKIKRLLIVLVLLFIVIVAYVVISTALNSGSKNNKAILTATAKQQALLIHIAAIGVEKAKSPDTQNLAITTSASLKSEQTALLAALNKAKVKLTIKQIAVTTNEAVDTQLTTAEQANQFDAKFTELLNAGLNAYLVNLQQAFNATESKSLKTALNNEFNNVSVSAKQKNRNLKKKSGDRSQKSGYSDGNFETCLLNSDT